MDERKAQTLILKGVLSEMPQEVQDAVYNRLEEIKQSIDLNKFIDFMAVCLFSGEIDEKKPSIGEDLGEFKELIEGS